MDGVGWGKGTLSPQRSQKLLEACELCGSGSPKGKVNGLAWLLSCQLIDKQDALGARLWWAPASCSPPLHILTSFNCFALGVEAFYPPHPEK